MKASYIVVALELLFGCCLFLRNECFSLLFGNHDFINLKNKVQMFKFLFCSHILSV